MSDTPKNALARYLTLGLAPDSNSFDLMASLGAELFIYRDKWFHDQDVVLDGFTFINCRFDNCRLFTDKGTFSIESSFVDKCLLYFASEAAKVVRLHNIGNEDVAKKWPDLIPKYDSMGRMTVTWPDPA